MLKGIWAQNEYDAKVNWIVSVLASILVVVLGGIPIFTGTWSAIMFARWQYLKYKVTVK
jgi:hypothetical protein